MVSIRLDFDTPSGLLNPSRFYSTQAALAMKKTQYRQLSLLWEISSDFEFS